MRDLEVAIVVSGKFRPELQACTLSLSLSQSRLSQLTATLRTLSQIYMAQNNNNAREAQANWNHIPLFITKIFKVFVLSVRIKKSDNLGFYLYV